MARAQKAVPKISVTIPLTIQQRDEIFKKASKENISMAEYIRRLLFIGKKNDGR